MKNLYIVFLLICIALDTVAQNEIKLSADDCRRMAVENSRRLERSALAERQAELDRRIADIARLPRVEGSATALYIFPDMEMMGMNMEMRGAYMAGVQLTQPIYAGGRITAGRRLARIGEKAAAEQLRLERMDVIADALRSYWTYVAVLDKVKLTHRYRAMIDTIYEQTSVAVIAGMATENDLLRISARRSEIIYNEKKAENGAELCRLALCNAVGLEYSVLPVPTDTAICVQDPGTPDYDISARPELALLKLQVEASRQQVKMALGDFLPTVGLSIGYNWYGNIRMKGMADAGNGMMVPYTSEFKDNMGMAALAVKIPVFHWGEGIKKVRKARIEVNRSRLDLEENSRLLELQTRQAAISLEDGWALISAAERALSQADENLRVMHNRYTEGMATLTDMLDAQNQWHQAHSDLIEATTQYQINYTDWLRTTGSL